MPQHPPFRRSGHPASPRVGDAGARCSVETPVPPIRSAATRCSPLSRGAGRSARSVSTWPWGPHPPAGDRGAGQALPWASCKHLNAVLFRGQRPGARPERAWPMLEAAILRKFEDQSVFVAWWDANIGILHGGDRSKSRSADRGTWSMAEAESKPASPTTRCPAGSGGFRDRRNTADPAQWRFIPQRRPFPGPRTHR